MFEDLPNETIISIFEYFKSSDLENIENLNQRMKSLSLSVTKRILFDNFSNELPINIRFLKFKMINSQDHTYFVEIISRCKDIVYLDFRIGKKFFDVEQIDFTVMRNLKYLKLYCESSKTIEDLIYLNKQSNISLKYLELDNFTRTEIYDLVYLFSNQNLQVTIKSFAPDHYSFSWKSKLIVKKVIFETSSEDFTFLKEKIKTMCKFMEKSFCTNTTTFVFKADCIFNLMFISKRTFIHCANVPLHLQSKIKHKVCGDKFIISKK